MLRQEMRGQGSLLPAHSRSINLITDTRSRSMAGRDLSSLLAPNWNDMNWAQRMGAVAWAPPDLPLFPGAPRPAPTDRSYDTPELPVVGLDSYPIGNGRGENAFTPVRQLAQSGATRNPAPDVAAEAPSGWLGTIIEAGRRGLVEATNETGDTLRTARDLEFRDKPSSSDEQPKANDYVGHLLQQPISEGWSDPRWWAARIAYGGAKSYPSAALGVAGAGLGSMAEPGLGTVLGGATGFALGSALQTLAPAYQRARAEGLDHDAAVERAWKETGIAGAFGAAMGAAPGASLFGRTAEGALKRPISEALAQIFGVQPGLGAAQHASTAYVEEQPITLRDLASTYAEGLGQGVALTGAHALARRPARRPTKSAQRDEGGRVETTRDQGQADGDHAYAAEPSATEAPVEPPVSAPAIRRGPPMLFDYTRTDPVFDVPQTRLQRYAPPNGVPEYIERINNPEVRARLKSEAQLGLHHGGLEWSNTVPLQEFVIGELGREKARKYIWDLFSGVAATSPLARNPQNIRMGSRYYELFRQGEPFPVPIVRGGRLYLPEPLPEGYGHFMQGLHARLAQQALRGGGLSSIEQPKTTGFPHTLMGNDANVMIDSRLARLIGLRDALGRPMDAPPLSGYGYIENMLRELAGETVVTPNQFGNALWIAYALRNGLKPSDAPWLRQFEHRIEVTANKLGLSKDDVARRFIRGEFPLKVLLGGVIAGSAASAKKESSGQGQIALNDA
jgi:hypothetical protein